MTQFEYISVAVAIVLSLAVVRLLDAIPHVTVPERRYWTHGVWVGFLLLWSAIFWWLSWSHSARDGEFDFRSFLIIVTPPGLLYLAATTLVTQSPSEVRSWREHYWNVRRKFFAYLLAFLLSLVSTSFVMQGVPLIHPLRAGQLVLLGLFTVGVLSDNRRAHEVIAGIASVIVVATVILTLAGILSPPDI